MPLARLVTSIVTNSLFWSRISNHPADARIIAERVLEHIRKPIVIDSNELVLSVSIGIASSAPHYRRPEELLRDAETAMSLAKQNPTESCWIFDPTLHEKSIQRTKLGVELRRALETDEVLSVFPTHRIRHSGEITGAEAPRALASSDARSRLLHSSSFRLPRTAVSIVPLGLKVIRDASRQIVAWHRAGFEHLSVAVNVSARQFRDRHFVESVERVIKKRAIEPRALKVELTESTAADDPAAAVKVLEQLKSLGVQTLMDDFGTGYSSLNSSDPPSPRQAQDRSLVHHAGMQEVRMTLSSPRPSSFLRTIFGLGAIAEGVETEEQLVFLRDSELRRVSGLPLQSSRCSS
ncbi:MAG: GGDEF domain-containing phosphodiesterase [Polyangiaceae bacterium]